MVSSSPMKVAQFPAEGGHTKEVKSLDLRSEHINSPISVSNGYATTQKSQDYSKLNTKESLSNPEADSDNSTNESTANSPLRDSVDESAVKSPENLREIPSNMLSSQDAQIAEGTHQDLANGNQSKKITGNFHDPLVKSYESTEPPLDSAQVSQGLHASLSVAPDQNNLVDVSERVTQRRASVLAGPMNEQVYTPSIQKMDPAEKSPVSIQSPAKSSELAASTTSRQAVAAAVDLEDGVLVGTRVSEGHENFVTAYNMLTGIRVAVSRCTAKSNRALSDADFSATDEISFHMNGGGSSPSSKYIFHFKDYAPWVFRHLRDAFGLDPADYLMSLTAKYIVSEMGSPGKSGSYFYYSRDFRFIIKTIRHSEHKLLRRVLRHYYSHVKTNPDTLVSQIYGLHRVKVSPGRKIHFLIMNNVFPAFYQIHERFDLKGSLLGREYSPNSKKPMVVYKDLDWLRQHRRIVLGQERRNRLIKQLEIDVKFLEKVNVMDYSLLVGIHDRSRGNAALDDALRKFAQFGPQDERQSQGEKQAASAAVNGAANGSAQSSRGHTAEKEFASLQMLLKRATPERLKEFDFADDQRSQSYFYREHGGFFSTNEKNEELDVIYYVGVIDFLTGYTFRKSVETFCKGLIHDRRELSAIPSYEYGERFLKFMRGSIGPTISSSKPQKKHTNPETAEASAKSKPAYPVPKGPCSDQDNTVGHAVIQNSAKKTTDSTKEHFQTPPIELPVEESQATEFFSADSYQNAAGLPSTNPQSSQGIAHKKSALYPVAITPLNEKRSFTSLSSTKSSASSRSPRCTAITSNDTKGETHASPSASTSLDLGTRRPSVVGYGLESHIEA